MMKGGNNTTEGDYKNVIIGIITNRKSRRVTFNSKRTYNGVEICQPHG